MLSAANCSANQPVTLKSPASGATLTSDDVEFQWNATPGAALYRVWVSSNNEPFVDVGTTTDTKLHADIANGPAIWYVETFFEGCTPLLSARHAYRHRRAHPLPGMRIGQALEWSALLAPPPRGLSGAS